MKKILIVICATALLFGEPETMSAQQNERGSDAVAGPQSNTPRRIWGTALLGGGSPEVVAPGASVSFRSFGMSMPSLFTFAFFSADGTLHGVEAFDNTTTTEKQKADLIEIMKKY